MKGILRLKLFNANIHPYRSCFMEIQQKDKDILAADVHCFKTAAKQCAFDNDTVAIHIFVKDFEMCTSLQLRFRKRTLKLCLKSSGWLKNSMQHKNFEVFRLVEKLNAAQKLCLKSSGWSKNSMQHNN